MIKVYLANLGAYNRGYMIGKHITLPMSQNRLEDQVNNILKNNEETDNKQIQSKTDEEYIILDYETELSIEISEGMNVFQLNEIAEEYENLSDNQQTLVKAILDSGMDNKIHNIIHEIDYYTLHQNIHNDQELGYHYISDEALPEHLATYFDHEAYGEDIRINEPGEFTKYGYVKKEC